MKKMRKYLSLLVIIVLTFTVFAVQGFATETDELSVTIDKVGTLYYTVENNEITITGYKRMIPYANVTIEIPETFEGATVRKIGEKAFYKTKPYVGKVVLPDTITYVGDYAFYDTDIEVNVPTYLEYAGDRSFGCTKLTTTRLPSTLTTIGACAFLDCDSIVDLNFSKSLKEIGSGAFDNCDGITEVVLPEGIEFIGSAFENCSNLTSVTIPNMTNGVIESKAFWKNTALKNVTIGNLENTTVGSYVFAGCTALENFTFYRLEDCTLGEYLFSGCTSLKKVTFRDLDNTTFGVNFFNGCTSLESVDFGDVLNFSIPENAFNNCTALETVYFDDASGVTIADNAFKGCIALSKFDYISFKSIAIGAYAFSECESLTDFDFTYVNSVGEYAFSKSGIESVEIPAGVTLAPFAFADCPKLLTAVVSASAESLFENSIALKEATFELSIEIPKRAFYGCTALEKVSAPKAVYVRSMAFYNCKALKTFEYKQIGDVESHAFYGCSSIDNIDLSKFRGAFYEIPNYAFYGCKSLKNIGNCSPWEIGNYAFYGCSSLESFDFSQTDTIYEYAFAKSGLTNVDLLSQYCAVGRRAFQECNNIKELYFKYDVFLGEEAFADCEGLESIIIGDDVEFIGSCYQSNSYYFVDCNNVKYFYIGKNFKDTHKEEAYCIFNFYLFTLGGLEAFEVSPENPYFFTDDEGVLYMNTTYENMDLVVLVCYPAGKTDTFYSTENALKDNARLFTIGETAFCDQQYLKELELTKTVIIYTNDEGDTVGFALRGAFCAAAIEKITFTGDAHFEAIGYMMFEDSNIKEIDLDGVIEIGTYAFYNCQNLESVSSDTCLYIYERAFEDCQNLKSAKFPNCLEIYHSAFKDCHSLAEIDFENLEYIDNYAFQYCKSLPATLELKNVKWVGTSAFGGCTNITTVIMPNCIDLASVVFSETNITEIVLGDVYVSKYAFLDCTTLKSVKAKGLTAAEKAFYGCTNLVSVEIENSASLGDSAFGNCPNLETFKAGSVTSIGNYAFSGCAKLEEFNCESVKSIGKYAFSGCTSFETLNLTSVESIGDYAFNNCTNLKLVQLAQKKCTFGTNCFANCPDVSFFCEENTDPYNYAVANNIPVCAVTINLQKEAYEYTGSEIEPSVIVSISGMTLVQNKDYILLFEDNIGRGTARVIVQFIGDFEGLPDAVRLFSITRADITVSQVEYVVDNEYSGEAIRPKVVVKYGDKVLQENVDYTITYNSGTDAGSMFFTIKGKGNYTGSIDCYYNIIRRDIAEATVSKDNDMVYTGDELEPKPTLTWNGFTLQEGVDYEIRYFENVNSGYGTMVIYGMGNFCGTQRVQFRIFGTSIENAVVSEISDQRYTGEEITPDITVTLNGETLTRDVDYTVRYENNIEKGTATVFVSGMGNYSGVIKQSFEITKYSVNEFTVFSETEMTETFDGTPLKPEMEVYFGTELLTEGVDYTVSLQNNVNVGTATVTIIGIGLYDGERSYNFTILPCEITENDISVSGNMEFNGSAVEPEITIFKNGTMLVENEDYIVTYSDNEDVGTAYITVEGVGNYQNTITLEYEIYSAEKISDGWTLENGKWAYYKGGEKLKNRWIQDSVGWCYVGADGYCVANKWVMDSVTWCYIGSDCRMVTNKWIKDSVGWCYVGADGRIVTNKWVKDSVGWCYIDNNGHCVTNGWAKDSHGWCYLGSDGRMVYSTWVKYNNNWYYLDSDGYMVTGTKQIDGKTYKFASNGVWLG